MFLTVLRLLVLVLVVLVASCGPACAAQAPPTIESELRRYGIPVTQTGLQSALKDKRPEVRSLAAGELGSMKDTASVQLIVQALEAEKDPLVRFNMADTLVSLDSQVGNRVLSQMCGDPSLQEDRRLSAASRLFDAGDFSCLPLLENVLRGPGDPSIKVSALLALARVKAMPAAFVPKIRGTLLASLQDPDSAVRQYASDCIATLGDKAAVPNLQTAIANESDEVTRKRMEESLKRLEKISEKKL
jgi:HEAT repeats